MATDEEDDIDLGSHDEYKVFCDPVHGHISLHPLLVKIIDTPQFQRLRNIRQLGSMYFIYPGASHNRFEHSIGTAYLAGKLACKIQQQKNPEITFKGKRVTVTDKDILCVEMAGLCHDLGHGPFSHMFDGVYMKRVKPLDGWKHEEGSCDMFDHLIKEEEVQKLLQVYKMGDKDKKFVKEMIAGPLTERTKITDPEAWFPAPTGPSDKAYEGRGEEKSFLYDIISNKKIGVDVDKWDYFARDCHHLGIRSSFDHNRFMKFVKVLKVVEKVDNQGESSDNNKKTPKKGRLQICARDKTCESVYEMFYNRSMLHRKACQHRVSKVIDCMIAEAMELAEPYVKIPGKKGVLKKFSDCIKDPVAYTKLNDSVLDLIIHLEGTGPTEEDIEAHLEEEITQSTEAVSEMQDDEKKKWKEVQTEKFKKDREKNLQKARNILDRVFQRKFYKQIGSVKSKTDHDGEISFEIIDHKGTKQQSVKEDLISKINKEQYGRGDREEPPCENTGKTTLQQIIDLDDTKQLAKGDLTLISRKVDYGMGRENPVDKFWFYTKFEPDTPIKIPKEDVSSMLPEVFQELEVLIFCKDDGKVKSAEESFKNWGEEVKLSSSGLKPGKGGKAKKEKQKRGVKRKSPS